MYKSLRAVLFSSIAISANTALAVEVIDICPDESSRNSFTLL